MRSKSIYIFRYTLPLIVLWCIAAWVITDSYFETRVQNILEEETRITEERAADLSDSLRRNLHYLSGIPNVVSRLTRVREATSQFGTSAEPSTLPYEKRKATWTQKPDLNDLSQYLAVVQSSLNVDLIYLVNAAGDSIASSNWNSAGTTIGTNYAERDFFLANKTGKPGMQYAVGKTTHIPGIYFASPVLTNGHFTGAVVSKIDVPKLSSIITSQANTYVTDANGVIILAHDNSLEMQALPEAAVFHISTREKMAHYLRQDFSTLAIPYLKNGENLGLLQILAGKIPHLRASRQMPEYGLTVYIDNDLNQLPSLGREQVLFCLLLAFLGSALLLSAGGILHYLNTIRNSKAILQESEAKLRGLFELSPLGLALTDMQGNYVEFNEAFRAICGYPENELKTLDYWDLTPKEYEQLEAVQIESLKNTGYYGPYEKEYIRKDGRRIPILLNGMLVSGRDDRHFVWSIVEDITEKKNKETLIWTQANFDLLTGLPNRRLLLDKLQQALASNGRSGKEGALLFIDLDNFKTLNDTLGHDIGDMLLKQVAQRLTDAVRGGDTVARLGGDEFVVMLEELSPHSNEAAEQTKAAGAKILAALNSPYMLGLHEHHSTPSIGATLFIDHRQPIENLLKQADIAMYQAKKAGRNTLRFFDPQMQETINTNAALENDLRKAIDQKQFQLYFQIQVDSTDHPIGAEALIRWIHPERGLVSPLQFIPLAEDSGLILPIGQWVLEAACTRINIWQNDIQTRDLILAVNVSAKQFHQTDFISQVQAVIKRHAIRPNLLKLELTEGMLLENIEDTIAAMNSLKEIGVQFSLDDFGTGYSSLQYLKRLPLNQLKIDQSFVRDLDTDSSDKAIVRTVIAMAQSLNLDVIAEGVETVEQRQFLLNEGCQNFQGYLFSKPVPIEQFEALLKRS